ncbi:unnamed protein product [Caenorhabditis sp. 36 PRJEB53466]|nr:unnamed protein product [Caenorhabditis sp. 36 PRJEB53466]
MKQALFLSILFPITISKKYSHDKGAGLKALNKVREQVAEEMQIANMYKMYWSEERAEAAHKRIDEKEDTCPKDLGKKEREIVMSFYVRDAQILKSFLTEVLIPPKNETNTTKKETKGKEDKGKFEGIEEGEDLGQLVKVWPTYSEVGCAECRNGENGPLMNLCHFGPGKAWKRSDVKNGNPGSECEKRNEVESGMCADSSKDRKEEPRKEALTSSTSLRDPVALFLFVFSPYTF